MADEVGSSWWDKALNAAVDVGKPIAQTKLNRLVNGNSEQQVSDEFQRYNQLNGSGSADDVLARLSPQSIMDFAFGNPLQGANTGNVPTQASGGNSQLWLIVAVLGAVLLFLAARRAR